MRAFLIGLIFLVAVAVLAGIGLLLTPLLIVAAFFLRLIIGLLFFIFAVWLLGKFIIFVWEKMKR